MRIRDIGWVSYIIKGGSWYSISLFFLLFIDVFSFFFLQFLDFPELFFCTKIDIIWRDHEEQISKEFSIWKQEWEVFSSHIIFFNFFFTSNKNFIHTLTSKSWGRGWNEEKSYKVRYYYFSSSYYNFSI